MLKFVSYDIVFQEIPDEVTLAVNISGCPNGCPGCHSPHLQQDIGHPLTSEALDLLLREYDGAITCFCFMGGDGSPGDVALLANWLREHYPQLKTAWYSGRIKMPEGIKIELFDYLKFGPYLEQNGGLRSRTTNQRLYHVSVGPNGVHMKDITTRFW